MSIDFGQRTIEVIQRLADDRSHTAREHYGHELSLRIEPQSRADFAWLMELVVPKVAALCSRYSSEWDGSNHVARWTYEEAAMDIQHDLENIVHSHTRSDAPAGSLWDAGDWLDASQPEVAATATDEQLKAMAQEIMDEAHADGIHLYGLDEYLERLRDEAREEADEE